MGKNFSHNELEKIVQDAVNYWRRDPADYSQMSESEFRSMVEDKISDAMFYTQPDDCPFDTCEDLGLRGSDVFLVLKPKGECVWQLTQAVRDRYGSHPSFGSKGAIPVVYMEAR